MTSAPRRPGLRAKVVLAFAVGALAISAILATGTYFTARHQLIEQRERTATRQAFADAALVRDSLLTSGAQVSDILGSISPPPGAVILLRLRGQWYTSRLDAAGPDLTADVRPIVVDGSVGLSWSGGTDPPSVVVGVPLPAVGAEYYEVVSAEELDRTLSTLALALWICAALTTLAGGLVGRAAGRSLLRPLDRVGGRPLEWLPATSPPASTTAATRPCPFGDGLQRHGRCRPRAHRAGCTIRSRRQSRVADACDDADYQPQPVGDGTRPPASRRGRGHADVR